MGIGIYVILELVGISILISSITLGRILELQLENSLYFAYLIILLIIVALILPAIIILKLFDTFFPRKKSPKKNPSPIAEAIIPFHNPGPRDIKSILIAQLIMWGTYIYISYEFADVYSDYGVVAGFLAVTSVILYLKLRLALEHKGADIKQLLRDTLVNIIIFITIYFALQFLTQFIVFN